MLFPRRFQEVLMDRSVHQARWMLAPVFGLCIGFLGLGLFVG